MLHVLELQGPLWRWERWFLLPLLRLLLVIFRFKWFAFGVEGLRFWVFSNGIVQEELECLVRHDVIIHLSTEILGVSEVLLLDVIFVSQLDQSLQLRNGVFGVVRCIHILHFKS